jgi:hypothetical protein
MKLTYTYRNGTVPPPHHFEMTIRIETGKPGVYEFRPGYPGMGAGIQVWRETFPISEAEKAALLKRLLSLGLDRNWKALDRPPVGGGMASLEVTEGRKTWKVPSFPKAPDDKVAQMLFVTVENAVPIGIRKKLKTRFDALARDKKPGL